MLHHHHNIAIRVEVLLDKAQQIRAEIVVMMQRCPLVIPFLMYSTRGRAFHVLRRARFPRNLATRSLTNTVEIATPPVMDWDDRIALQKSWSNSEKGWKVDVEWKMTPFGVGLFAAQDIVAGTILRTGVIGCNLKELSSIADIEAFCQSGREDEYDARLRYVADYLWGFTVRGTDKEGYVYLSIINTTYLHIYTFP